MGIKELKVAENVYLNFKSLKNYAENLRGPKISISKKITPETSIPLG